jgi:hypothetical protein
MGLRVADSSIFPRVTNGNLNAPSIMVGEKAADHILGRTPLPLRQGAATAYTRYSDRYVADEAAARASGTGIWQARMVTPEAHRRGPVAPRLPRMAAGSRAMSRPRGSASITCPASATMTQPASPPRRARHGSAPRPRPAPPVSARGALT